MTNPADPSSFKEALIILGAAGIVIPLFHRLRVGTTLGFMLVGVAVGPFGLGSLAHHLPELSAFVITDTEAIAPIAELGVVLLLFMIGLELSLERLVLMRRLVFGLGALQLLASAAAIGAAALALGESRAGAVVFGLALAMSSTAIVIQVLSTEHRLGSAAGRASVAVLLLQDLAVVPVLFILGVMDGDQPGGGAWGLAWVVLQAILAVLGVVALGRLALRPMFRSVARTGSPELFVAICLLVVLATGLATAAAGLSMAMGALVAGLLLSGTEYRKQVEVTIEPFKGLALGVFLISVGMGLDLGRLAAAPLAILAAAAALVAAKAAIVALLGRLFGLPWRAALRSGLLLGPGGEFGLVIFGIAAAGGLMPAATAGFGTILATLTMAVIPLLSALGNRADARLAPAPVDPALLPPERGTGLGAPHVIVAGFGRVGQTVSAMLERHRIPFVALDNDADQVARQRAKGRPIYWGDGTRIDLLRRLDLDAARALVVTMSNHAAVDEMVEAARQARPDLLIVARARDAGHAAHLYHIGATDAVPETVEASLQLSEAVLVDIGVAMGPVIASIHEKRAEFQAEIRARAPDRVEVRSLGRRRLRDAAATAARPGS